MNRAKILKTSGYAVGGLALLVGSFVVVAAINGTPLSTLPVIGGMFPEPEPLEAALDSDIEFTPTIEEAVAEDRRPPRQVLESTTSILETFVFDTPLNAADLEALEEQLQARMAELDQRERSLAQQERDLDERMQHYNDLHARFESMMQELEGERLEAERRRQELDQAEAANEQRLEQNRVQAAQLYADGDPDDAAKRLLSLGAEEAGKLLALLPPDRAATLMASVFNADEESYPTVEASYRQALGPRE